MATVAEPVVHGKPVVSQLKTNTLNLFDTTVIATSSVAPAYTLAATAAILIAAVGLQSPAALLVGFFPVLFIAIAYYYLNRMDPNCGASYSWVSRTLNPYIGWISGWVQLAANVLFCAAAPIVAGTYTLQLLNSLFPGQISSTAAGDAHLIAVIGIAWLLFVTFMVVRGIRVTANFQWILVFIEYLIVLGFAVYAIIKVVTGNAPTASHVASNWFNPFSLGSLDSVVIGGLLAVFFFWGWDTAANVNEESKDANTSPGLAGIFSMFILLFIFLIAATAIQVFLSQTAINDPNNQGDILYFFAQQLTGTPIAYFMILAVLSSTVATTQTTLLPSSRLSFSMARDGVFPKWFGLVHPSWKTPWLGTIISSALAIAIIVVTLLVSSVNTVFSNLILDIGVLVAVYYGITGFASAWAFRKVLLTSFSRFVFAGLLPVVGGLALFFFAYSDLVPSGVLPFANATDWGTGLPILITIGLGVPLVLIAKVADRSGFFREKTVSYVTVDGRLTASPAAPIS
ncbi:MAG TPA: APC family permease [Candidatus Dormibacteraeota bacterium]